MDNVKIGRMLKDARSNSHLTQKDLANKSGVGVRTIIAFENGKLKRPSLECFYKLFKHTGYNPGDVLKKY